MNKKGKSTKILTTIIAVIVLLISVLFTYGPKNLWHRLIRQTRVETNTTVQASQSYDDADYPLSVHYIDVGQGDSTLIRFNEYNILIDCAKKSEEEKVFNYLDSQGVDSLDMVIATHPDADHIGGFADLVYQIKPALYLMPQLPDSIKRTQTELTLINTLKTVKVKTEYAVDGKEYAFDDLHLVTYLTNEEHEDKNDYSIVVKITYKEASYLFMGDAGKAVERELMNKGVNLNAYVLKAGHHGSSKSTAEKFVKYVNPGVCIFSCGEGNDYGHPHSEVLQIMKKLGITYYRTDLNGTVVVVSDGKSYRALTQK